MPEEILVSKLLNLRDTTLQTRKQIFIFTENTLQVKEKVLKRRGEKFLGD